MLQEGLMVLSWKFQRVLKGMLNNQRCYVYTAIKATTTTVFAA